MTRPAPQRRLGRLRRRLAGSLSGEMRHRAAIARDAVPPLLAALGGDAGRHDVPAPGQAGKWELRELAHNPDGPLVLEAVPLPTGPSLVVKVATDGPGAQRLAGEAAALRLVHEGPALSGWRVLTPRVLALRAAPGAAILVTTRLPGHPPDPRLRGAERDRLVRLAALALAPLHEATADIRRVDDAVLDAWIGQPIATLERALAEAGVEAGMGRPMQEVEVALREGLTGRSLRMSMVHGDLWLDNVLLDDAGAVSGIVDWEAAGSGRSPVEDLVGLLMAARRVGSGRHTGEVAAELLTELETTSDQAGRDRWLWDAVEAAGTRPRSAVLLAWLAALDGSLRRRPSLAGDRAWLRRNTEPVRLALHPTRAIGASR